jgi:hypothetical protein
MGMKIGGLGFEGYVIRITLGVPDPVTINITSLLPNQRISRL